MPISKAGISTRGRVFGQKAPCRCWKRSAGFTLLELVVVITILGITALMVFPKLSAFGVAPGKAATRHLTRLIQHLAQESAATKKVYRLHYDLDTEAYSVKILQGLEFIPVSDGLVSGRELPKGLSFEDVVTARHGKVREGEVFTEFFSLGVERTVIHLKEGEGRGERIWTLMVNGLTGRVRVFDEYVEKIEHEPL